MLQHLAGFVIGLLYGLIGVLSLVYIVRSEGQKMEDYSTWGLVAALYFSAFFAPVLVVCAVYRHWNGPVKFS